MRRVSLVILILSLAAWTAWGAETESRRRDGRGAIVADTTLTFQVEAGSRLYPDWKEEHTVRLGERFFLGDLPFTASVEGFMSDFKIGDKGPENAAPTMTNPAVFVMVYNDSGPVDSSWAFLNFPPHFSPKSFFHFQLKGVEGYEEPVAGGKGN